HPKRPVDFQNLSVWEAHRSQILLTLKVAMSVRCDERSPDSPTTGFGANRGPRSPSRTRRIVASREGGDSHTRHKSQVVDMGDRCLRTSISPRLEWEHQLAGLLRSSLWPPPIPENRECALRL